MRTGLTIGLLLLFGPLGCGVESGTQVRFSPEADLELLFSTGEGWPVDGVPGQATADSVLIGLVADAAITAEGGLVVLDAFGPRALRFSSEGAFLGEFGGPGEGPGEFSTPASVVSLESGVSVIWDPGLGRMSVFEEDATFLRSWSVPEFTLTATRSLFSGEGDNLFLRVSGHEPRSGLRPRPFSFVRFDLAGLVGDTLRFPGDRVEVPLIEGPIQDAVPFAPYPDWTVLVDGTIAVTPRRDYRITVFGSGGDIRWEVDKEVSPVPVLPEEAAVWRSTLTEVVRRLQPGWRWEGGDIPSLKPAIRTLLPADDGRLVVMPHNLARSDPERTGVGRWAELDVVHVYSPSGELKVAFSLPPGSRLLRVRGDRVLALSRGALDAPQLDLYRMVIPSQP